MTPHRNVIILLIVLIASLLLNGVFALAARHYYIATKLRSVEPTYVHRFDGQNAPLRTNGGRPLIALFGDSRIANWEPLPRSTEFDIVNRGIGGETTAQMRYRFEQDIITLHPEFVIIQGGINDLVAAGLAPQIESKVFRNTISNLTAMVAQAQSSGIKVVLLTIIPPAAPDLLRRVVWSDRIPALVADANRELALLHTPPSVEVIDTRPLLQDTSGAWKPGMILDTLHLAQAGYETLNMAVTRIIAKR